MSGKICLTFEYNHTKGISDSKSDDLKCNCQSFNSTCETICVKNGRLFYFKDYGKLESYYILQIR